MSAFLVTNAPQSPNNNNNKTDILNEINLNVSANGGVGGGSTANRNGNGHENVVANREFVEGWTLAQTLGEGAYGE